MSLDSIGFYTLTDARVAQLSPSSPMWRCELILTDRCNFQCGYCRGLKPELQGDMPIQQVDTIIANWSRTGLKNIRFSGGEPTLYPHLVRAVKIAKYHDVERVAISTNGSASQELYQELVTAGVDDFSISLDACCAGDCALMAGVKNEKLFDKITDNIRFLSSRVYTTVGVVLTPSNVDTVGGTIQLAHELGVHDIRIIPSAQWNGKLVDAVSALSEETVACNKILSYRVNNIIDGRHVRGIQPSDSKRCYLPIDDSAVAGTYHFPCVIYLREMGAPIGKVGKEMRAERIAWSHEHNTHADPICKKNCLDVCIDYNNAVRGQPCS